MYLDKYNLSVERHKKLRQIARGTPTTSSNGAKISIEKPSKNDDSDLAKETPPKVLDSSEQKAFVIKSFIVQAIEIFPSYQFEQIIGYIKQDNQLIT
ncbi:hypothetical protein EYC80_004609 [Monilinia laxa]|uniref:Uncharacterized protein n=1 Tax=Monilinia laxa TaxID=61186 RepID=A0A5N6KHU2_MONLA|nr:hypothetical protein EYC80_004609 [Monilinia laxa]